VGRNGRRTGFRHGRSALDRPRLEFRERSDIAAGLPQLDIVILAVLRGDLFRVVVVTALDIHAASDAVIASVSEV